MEYKKHLPKLDDYAEAKRLQELYSLEILDTPPDEQLDNIVNLASQIIDMPISLVSLVDNHRQWFKARVGLDAVETPREVAFCTHAITGQDIFVVNDARTDKRFADNPLVTEDPNVIFYAGVPLNMGDGVNIGTLCIIDNKPRKISKKQKDQLKLLGEQVVFLLKHHRREIIGNKISKILARLHKLHFQDFDSLDQIIQKYLYAGTELLNLDYAISSKIDEQDKYIIESCISPFNELEIGAEFELSGTYCSEVVSKENTLYYKEVGKINEMKSHPVYQAMKLESYIGTPIWVNGRIYGTLNFSSKEVRKRQFTDAEIQFIEILADLIGKRISEYSDKQRFKYAFKIFDKSPDFIGIASVESGKTLFHNKAFEEIVGKKGSDELDIRDFHPKWAGDLVKEVGVPQAIENGVWSGETALLTKDAKEIPVLQTIVTHKDIYNEVKYISTIMQNITKQKELENKLIEAKENALETAKLKSDFLATVSHEIRTPMNGILGMVSLLSSTSLKPDQKEMLSTIKNCGKDLLSILNDVLDLSKMESNRMLLENIPFSLQSNMEELTFLFLPKAKERGNKLELQFQKLKSHYFFGDPLRIKQIISNFVSNAIKFTENGKVEIKVEELETRDNHSSLKISVVDNGMGIKEENQKKIFEAFSQEDSSTSRMYGGTGLGLSISTNLANLMGADIELQSKYNIGSSFSIQLNLQHASESELLETKREIVEKKEKKKHEDLNNLHLLVVEDNPINLKLAKAFLSKLGHKADYANNGADAIEKLSKKSYDIVLMDIQMPVMDGITATKNIRKMEINQPYIIALTANVLEKDLQKYKRASMDTHLGKPFTCEELANILNTAKLELESKKAG